MNAFARAASSTVRTRVATACALVLLAIGGCSMFNPYDHARLEELAPPSGLKLAGGAGEALEYAESLRLTYYKDLQSTSIVRNSSGTVAILLSGWGIYNALKPGGASAAAATPGDVRRSVRIGAALASLYGLRQFFVNPDEETIYAEAYRALTCMMVQSAPLLMTEASGVAGVPVRTDGELDVFRDQLKTLSDEIDNLNVELARDAANANAVASGDHDVIANQKDLRDQFASTTKALVYAKNALTDGRLLVSAIEGSGRDIRGRAANIVAVMNQQIQTKQQDLGKAADVLKNAHDITGGVLSIGATTASDQVKVTAPAASLLETGNADRALALDATIPRVRNLSFLPLDSSWRMVRVAGVSGEASAPVPASSAASAPPATAGTAAKPGKAAKVKAAPAGASDTLRGASLEELQGVRDKLDAAIKGINDRATQAEKDKNTQELAKRDKEIQDLKSKRDAGKLVCKDAQSDVGGCAADLAVKTEKLYKARRQVVNTLLDFRSQVRKSAAVQECVELASLRIAPNDVVRAKPGDTINYLISQRDAGSPLAVLDGPTDKDVGAVLTYKPLMGTTLYQAEIAIGARMPEQTLRLIISDSKVVSTQILSIVSVGPPLAAASAASEPAAKPPATAAVPAAPAASPPAAGGAGKTKKS